MTRYRAPAIQAVRVGGGNAGGMPEPVHTPVARQRITYHCANPKCVRGTLVVTFAEGTEPWDAAECRCGEKALRKGAPKDAQPFLPGYGSVNGGQASTKDLGTDPQSQLRKRRTKKDGAALLAEALRARQSEVGR